MADKLDTVGIVVKSTGAEKTTKQIKTVEQAIDDVGQSANKANAYVEGLKNTFEQASEKMSSDAERTASTVERTNEQAANSYDKVAKAQQRMGTSFYHTGMYAAQFQDIVISGAMKMNPVMVGIQQGTQIAGQALMTGGSLLDMFKNMGKGFAALFGPITMTSVAMAAFLAHIVQSISWMNVYLAILKGVSFALRLLSLSFEYLLKIFVVLAIAQIPRIISGFASIYTYVTKLNYAGILPLIKSYIALGTVQATLFPELTAIKGVILAIIAVVVIFTDVLGYLNSAIKWLTGIDIGSYFSSAKENIDLAADSLDDYIDLKKQAAGVTEELGEKELSASKAMKETQEVIYTAWEGFQQGVFKFYEQATNVGAALMSSISASLDNIISVFSDFVGNIVFDQKNMLDNLIEGVRNWGRRLLSEMAKIAMRFFASKLIEWLVARFPSLAGFTAKMWPGGRYDVGEAEQRARQKVQMQEYEQQLKETKDILAGRDLSAVRAAVIKTTPFDPTSPARGMIPQHVMIPKDPKMWRISQERQARTQEEYERSVGSYFHGMETARREREQIRYGPRVQIVNRSQLELNMIAYEEQQRQEQNMVRIVVDEINTPSSDYSRQSELKQRRGRY